MHNEAMDFCRRVQRASPGHFSGKSVLEVGAFNVNGSARDLFSGCTFAGVDCREGPNVSHVCDAGHLPFASASFDVTFSTETFEHAQNWRTILKDMRRVTKHGGLVFVTAATTGRNPHGCDGGDVGEEFYGPIIWRSLRMTDVGRVLLWEEDYAAGDIRAAWLV